MKKTTCFLAALLTLLVLPLKGQTIVQGNDTIGMMLMDSTFVMSPYMDFGRPVYSMQTSPQQDYLLMMFRDVSKDGKKWKKSGEIGLLRLSDRELMWTQPFNYNTTSFLHTAGCCHHHHQWKGDHAKQGNGQYRMAAPVHACAG